MLKDGTAADGFRLTRAFCSGCSGGAQQKREDGERTGQSWEVFIEIAGPCSSSHLRTPAPLCSLSDLFILQTATLQRLKLHWNTLQSPVWCVRRDISVSTVPVRRKGTWKKRWCCLLGWSRWRKWKGRTGLEENPTSLYGRVKIYMEGVCVPHGELDRRIQGAQTPISHVYLINHFLFWLKGMNLPAFDITLVVLKGVLCM